jgi:CRP/FNR family transcriptional regulator, cyclic AMP receptor protein
MIDLELLEECGASTKKLAADEIIFLEGSECYFYHQVISGHVRWVNFTEDGGEFIQEMIGPGESFGEYPLFDNLPYAASAVANEETVIIRLRKDKFLKLLESNPPVQMDFLKMYTVRLRFKALLLKEISCYGPVHQISTLFNYFKQQKKNICDTCNVVQLTRQQIADMTGLRVETVIRSIRQMKQKGKVNIDKGKVLLPAN